MRFFKKDELRILWPFYLDSILANMLFFAPAFFVVYFRDIGLTAFQMGILFAITLLTQFLFEIPTGAIADLYGRKFSVLLGLFLEGIGFFILFFSDNFYYILSCFAFIGFAATLSSGSKEAWITDLLRNKRKDLLHDFFSKQQIFDSFGLVVSGIIGAFLVKIFGVLIIWPIAGSSYLITILILIFASEIYRKRKIKIQESLKDIKKQTFTSVNFAFKHNVLFYLLLASVILGTAMGFQTNISWVPFLQSLGFADYQFGYLWSGIGLVVMIAPFFSMKFLKKGKEKKFIIFSLIMAAFITLLILFAYHIILALSVLFGAMFFFFMKSPAERVYFHRFIPSKLRATIGSVEGVLLSFAGIIAFPIVGFLVDKIGGKYTIFISGLIMIPGIITYLMIKEK